MGTVLEKMCCVDNEDIGNEYSKNFDYEDHQFTMKDNNEHEIVRNKSFKKISFAKLPSAEMKLVNPRSPMVKIPKTISKIPVSTRNIIRKLNCSPLQYYDIINKIGEGSYGRVYKVRHKVSGVIRALKYIKKNNVIAGFSERDLDREITVLQNLNHPYIMKLYEFYVENDSYGLISEYCSDGDLYEKMKKLKKVPESIVKIFMFQIFKALIYLNSKKIIHGDLKLENILVDSLDESEIDKIIRSKFNKNIDNVNEPQLEEEEDKFILAIKNDTDVIKKKYTSDRKLEIYNEFFKHQNLNLSREDYQISHCLSSKNNNILSSKTNNIQINSASRDNGFNTNLPVLNTSKIENGGDITINRGDISPFKFVRHKNTINFKQRSLKSFKRQNSLFKHGNLYISNYCLKLTDFGCSKMFFRYKHNFQDIIGTTVYCSPEVLQNDYNNMCDIWSCGVIMYKLLCGKFPFIGHTEEETQKLILQGKFHFKGKAFEDVSNEAKDLITQCLTYDVEKRITPTNALKHEFFEDIIDNTNFTEDEKKTLINLLKFKKCTKFYQVVLVYLAYNFNDKKLLNQICNIYYKIDLDSDGKITKPQLLSAYHDANIPVDMEKINKLVEAVDFDNNGYIEFEEFVRVCLPKEKLFTEENLKHAFELFDKYKKGFITVNEVEEILGLQNFTGEKLSEELKKQLLGDGNENLDFKRFKKMVIDLSRS